METTEGSRKRTFTGAAAIAQLLIHAPKGTSITGVVNALAKYGEAALNLALKSGVRVVILAKSQTYTSASAALARLGIDVDSWPAPPAGLFVVEERTVYLRSRSPMTSSHEFGHALDCALGGGVYFSGIDPTIRRMFANANAFVTPYAATGIDEYVAEAFRAFVECNDVTSHWPRATKERLNRVDPEMYAWVARLFASGFDLSSLRTAA